MTRGVIEEHLGCKDCTCDRSTAQLSCLDRIETGGKDLNATGIYPGNFAMKVSCTQPCSQSINSLC